MDDNLVVYERREILSSLFFIADCQKLPKLSVTLCQNQYKLHMLEEFVKWMAALPERERDQKIEILINIFAPSPAHEDFKRLKGALKRK